MMRRRSPAFYTFGSRTLRREIRAAFEAAHDDSAIAGLRIDLRTYERRRLRQNHAALLGEGYRAERWKVGGQVGRLHLVEILGLAQAL
jgi:hypothetical protein